MVSLSAGYLEVWPVRPHWWVMVAARDEHDAPDDWATRRTRGSSLRRVLDAATRRESEKQRLIQAPNWRTPIIVDTVLGVAFGIIGVVLAITWSPLPGGAIGAAGFTYAVMAVSRGRRWARLRDGERDASGDDDS